jgi:hypothetical protein
MKQEPVFRAAIACAGLDCRRGNRLEVGLQAGWASFLAKQISNARHTYRDARGRTAPIIEEIS